MAEVFISYSQKDRALVAPIAARLTELGVDAWYDREISAGERFGAVIRARLKEAKAVLACWSPEAIQSDWVEAEADYARELGTYVPVFVSPCALMPPFNRIHTDDLSKWTGEANDPAWIRLVDRIAKLIGRDGVAAAARALATGDEQARYDFARRYPDEPTATEIWNAAEGRHREHFTRQMAEARSAAEARIKAERAALDARLKATAPAFELWLAEERRAAAKGPPPDPLDLVEQTQPGDDVGLRDEIAALQGALAQAKTTEGDLAAAKGEIARLSEDLAASKARDPIEPTDHGVEQRLRDEIANLQRGQDQAKTREAEFDAAKAEAAGLSVQLAAARAARSRAWTLVALIGLVAAGAGALAERSVLSPATDVGMRVKEEAEGKADALAALADLRHESDGLKAQVGRLSADLASARDSLEAADKKRTETQARTDSLAKELEDARAHASNLEKELAAVEVKPGTQALPPAQALSRVQAPPTASGSEKPTQLGYSTSLATGELGWFVVVGDASSAAGNPLAVAQDNLGRLNERCGYYKTKFRIVKLGVKLDYVDSLETGNWTVALGPYRTEDETRPVVLIVVRECSFSAYAEHGRLMSVASDSAADWRKRP